MKPAQITPSGPSDSPDASTRQALRSAINAAVFELREAKARGDAHRAAQWALFINETTNIIIGEQRRRRLP